MRLANGPINARSQAKVVRVDDQLSHAESVAAVIRRPANDASLTLREPSSILGLDFFSIRAERKSNPRGSGRLAQLVRAPALQVSVNAPLNVKSMVWRAVQRAESGTIGTN